MKRKPVFYTELAYVVAIVTMAFGAALMERADFGVSMVVAPAYLIHLKVSQFLPFFTFGMAEYTLQAVLLLLLSLFLRKFKLSSLFSFVTAVLYGFTLDGCMALIRLLPFTGLAWRLGCYLAGMLVCAFGVSCFFHTYLAPEVYELFVKELSGRFGWDIHKVKTVYDICSCLVAVLLSFCFFGFLHFEGVKWGTVVCALVNGFLISLSSKALERLFTFKDGLPWRKFFEK